MEALCFADKIKGNQGGDCFKCCLLTWIMVILIFVLASAGFVLGPMCLAEREDDKCKMKLIEATMSVGWAGFITAFSFIFWITVVTCCFWRWIIVCAKWKSANSPYKTAKVEKETAQIHLEREKLKHQRGPTPEPHSSPRPHIVVVDRHRDPTPELQHKSLEKPKDRSPQKAKHRSLEKPKDKTLEKKQSIDAGLQVGGHDVEAQTIHTGTLPKPMDAETAGFSALLVKRPLDKAIPEEAEDDYYEGSKLWKPEKKHGKRPKAHTKEKNTSNWMYAPSKDQHRSPRDRSNDRHGHRNKKHYRRHGHHSRPRDDTRY